MNASNTASRRLDTATGAMPFASRIWRVLSFGDRLARRAAVVLWLAAAVGVALFFGWSFVVAAGLSTLVLSLLPCAAMCALGLCAGSSGKQCADDAQTKENHP